MMICRLYRANSSLLNPFTATPPPVAPAPDWTAQLARAHRTHTAPAGNGRNDADDRVFFDGRFFLLEISDIVVPDKNIYIGTDISALIQQMFFQIGKIQGQFLYGIFDGAGLHLQSGRIVGKFP